VGRKGCGRGECWGSGRRKRKFGFGVKFRCYCRDRSQVRSNVRAWWVKGLLYYLCIGKLSFMLEKRASPRLNIGHVDPAVSMPV